MKNELFKEGDRNTSLSAEEMNRRIVRPLNAFLRMVATPPLRLVKADAGWLLYDERATGKDRDPDINIPIEPSFCMVPVLTALINAQVNATNTGADSLSPTITKTFECAYVLEIDYEIQRPRWKPGGSSWTAFMRDDGNPGGGNLVVLAEATNEGMTGVTEIVTGTVQIHISAGTSDVVDMAILNFGYPTAVGYFKITDARFVSSTPP